MFTEVAPRFAPPSPVGSYFCTFFPPSTDPRIEITGAGAGPILVCGTTGDAAMPLQGTRAMAEALEDSHLVVVDANTTRMFRSVAMRRRPLRRLPHRPRPTCRRGDRLPPGIASRTSARRTPPTQSTSFVHHRRPELPSPAPAERQPPQRQDEMATVAVAGPRPESDEHIAACRTTNRIAVRRRLAETIRRQNVVLRRSGATDSGDAETQEIEDVCSGPRCVGARRPTPGGEHTAASSSLAVNRGCAR